MDDVKVYFLTKGIITDNTYWDGIDRISNFLNKFLHDALVGEPFVIRKILFWIWRTFLLNAELPQKMIQYSITEWKCA